MAERHPREAALRRVHGSGDLFAAAYGNVGSSIYYALGVVALYALGLTPVTFMIAGLIFAFTAASYAEATVLYPEAGGSSSFARHAFNEAVSFFAAWGQMLTYIVTIAISAFFVPHYLAVFWEPLGHGPGDVIFGIVLVGLLAALNVKGTEESSRLNLVLAIADLLTQVVLVIIGLAIVFDPDLLVSQVDLGVAPSWGDFLLGIAVGMVAYTGIETISNMAEEARDASRTIPRGVGATVIAVVVLYAFLPAIALSAMPVTEGARGEFTTELGTTFADDPVLGIVENIGLSVALTDVLEVYVGILAAVILLIATNAALIGVSRLTFSMGQHRQLPEGLRQVHPRFKTPYVAILVFSGFAALTIVPGETTFLATLYSFGATLSFTIAHVSVVRLRKLQPLAERKPDRDGNPALATVGQLLAARRRGADHRACSAGLGTLGGVHRRCRPRPGDPRRRRRLDAASGWAPTSLYRRHQGLPLRQTVKVEALEPLGVQEVEYRSVLVAFDDDPFSEEMVATAKRLGARRRRAIHVLSLVNVPTHLPLDARLGEQDGIAQSKIERAKLICGQRVTGTILRVRPGPGGSGDRRAGEGDRRGGDRDAASLPKRRAAVRQDPADGARRAPHPGDRRGGARARRPDDAGARGRRSLRCRSRRSQPARGPRIAPMASPPKDEVYRAVTRLFAVIIAGFGAAIVVVTIANGGGPRSVGIWIGLLFCALGLRPALPLAQDPRLTPLPRRPDAVRRRLLGGRLLDLLLARAGRRLRPRADAAGLPRRRARLRPQHPQLRRGRVDVRRARRLGDVRPPRLQRAGQLRRRLGDPDRLRDRDRPGGDLGAALPDADLVRVHRRRGRDRHRRLRDRPGRGRSRSPA